MEKSVLGRGVPKFVFGSESSMKSWSIGVKLALQITAVIILVMVVLGVLSVYQQERKFENILHERAAWMAQQLALTLGAPLWNMDGKQLDYLLRSYLSNPDILSIEVREPGAAKAMRFIGKDPDSAALVDFLGAASVEPDYADTLSRQAQIIHDQETIGHIDITFSRQFITSQTRQTMGMVGLVLLCLVGVETLIILVLVRRKISAPLAENVRAAAQIASGDVEVHLTKMTSGDEIGSLNAAFRDMISYLREMAARANEISSGDLQSEFVPTSKDDVLGGAFLQMTHYLQEMAAVATTIAGGDLRRDIRPNSERDALGTAFQKMAFLRRMVSQTMDGSVQLETASGSLKQMSMEMAGAAQQASQQIHSVSSNGQEVNQHVADIASAMTEASATIREITLNTRKVAEVATTAMQIATTATAVIETQTARSREIGTIVDLITGIARQIHLLALNATIEAARSGDAGRRFAVVAAEVKELATKTTQSADDISRRVEAIQVSSGESSEAIRQLSTIVQQIDELATVIAAALEQQDSTQGYIAGSMSNIAGNSEGITRTMTDVAGVSAHISELASSVQQAAEELNAVSAQLQQVVEQFKI